MLEDFVHGERVKLILDLRLQTKGVISNRPPIRPIKCFIPPTIPHAKVQASVGDHFFSARSTRLQRTRGIIQPYIATMVQVASHVEVVILDKNNSIFELGQSRDLHDLLDELFSALVRWVGLARKEELNRSLRIVDDLSQLIQVSK